MHGCKLQGIVDEAEFLTVIVNDVSDPYYEFGDWKNYEIAKMGH